MIFSEKGETIRDAEVFAPSRALPHFLSFALAETVSIKDGKYLPSFTEVLEVQELLERSSFRGLGQRPNALR